MRTAAGILVCLTLIACGSDDDDADGGRSASEPQGADLAVTVRPKGDEGPTWHRRIECERLGEGSAECRRLDGLTMQRLAPVHPDTACAELYGGPARARVLGELRGRRVDASFSRVNSCEIERWDRNRALLARAS